MIKNFFTVAFRNFIHQKLYSFINVFGLASGLTCVLFIYLWVNDEVSKDTFHAHSEKIFRVVSNLELNEGEIVTWDETPGPLAEDIRDNIAGVELVARTMELKDQLFRYGSNAFMENGCYADPSFFQIFSLGIVKGKPVMDSADVSSVSLSNRLAHKLFGNEDAIGKTVTLNSGTELTVAAVFEDAPARSSLRFDFVLPLAIYKKQRGLGFNWGNHDHPLYVKLNDAVQAEAITAKINERIMRRAKEDGDRLKFYMQPFADSYLYSQFENGIPVGGRIKYVRIFSVVAMFILAIACINFMNMATARAVNRSKEVGVRKVVGAQRKGLIFQFIAESMLVSCMAMILSLVIVYLLLPMFNSLVGKEMAIDFTDIRLIAVVVGMVIVTGVLAGSYPAFFLSSYQPAQVLKASAPRGFSGATLRKALVIFQFALTVILVACSLSIYNQIEFIRSKDIGYNRQAVLTFKTTGNVNKQFDAFRNEVLQFPGIVSISRANASLVEVLNQNGSVEWPGKPANSRVLFRTIVVDYDFAETMGLKLLQGRFFKKEYHDTASFIVNQRAVEVMGLTDPIGAGISQWGNRGAIVGVVDDFHSRSLHEAIDPMVLMCRPDWTGKVFARFDGGQAQQALVYLEKVYKKYNPEYPFSYAFMSDDFERLYNTEKITGSLALSFTIMAIIISALGLLGLAAYTAERKRKEIGIRKTLGASASAIVAMMSGDFVKLSLIAALIGCPVAYYLVQQFLAGYVYHVEVGWELFVITAVTVLAISLVTVIFQVTRAAVANPVDALRNE